MKQYRKPTLTKLEWADGQSRWQAARLFASSWYQKSFAPGEIWEEDLPERTEECLSNLNVSRK